MLPLLRALDPPPSIALVTAYYSYRRALHAFQSAALLLTKPESPTGLADLIDELELAASNSKEKSVAQDMPTLGLRSFGPFTLGPKGLFTPSGFRTLRRAERSLLAHLLQRMPQIVSGPDIARTVLDRRDRAALALVRRHIANLRDGLGPYGWLVQSVAGKGYCLAARAFVVDEAC